jgi:hypothetical protein
MREAPKTRTDRAILPLTLRRDGRLAQSVQLDRLAKAAATATDCFVFCHGWLYGEAEAAHEARRFFALLDQALASIRERVAPVHVALHWPSKPFADAELTRRGGDAPFAPVIDAGLWLEIERHLRDGVRRSGEHAVIARVLHDLYAAEIPRSPEEERELDALAQQFSRARCERGALPISPFHALSFWVMKRRAGEVGERLGRETLGPLWRSLRSAPRLHLIGHSFGAKLVTSMVLGGVAPESLILLLGAFSAFAFAPEIPGFDRPGFYHRVLAERRVAGRIVVLRSDHDTALATLYRTISGSGEVGRTGRIRVHGRAGHPCTGNRDPRRGGAARAAHATTRRRTAALGPLAATPCVLHGGPATHRAAAVATSALGAVGARGVGAPEIDLIDAQRIGLPRYLIVNVDGSRVCRTTDALIGAHRDIHHAEVANLVLLAAGLLVGGPDGIRPVPFDPVLQP